MEKTISLQFMVRCFYNQFLPKNMKVVYGLRWDSLSGKASNRGNYYYMNDQEYLYDFCKFIKDKEIVDEYGYSILGDTLLKFSYDRTREYFVDTHIYGESTVKKSKTFTYHK